ncbi:MAG: PAS domain S-box protein, partial [Desulfurivibrionaceae bacterium]
MMKTLYLFLFGTLRGRLIIGVAVVHAVMMALFITDLTARQRAMLLDHQIAEATALSQALATSAAGWIAADDISGLQELVEAQRRYPELIFAMLANQEGRVLADTDKSGQELYMLDLPFEARQTVLANTSALVDVITPAMIGGRQVGWARVGIGQKRAGEKLTTITRDGIAYALAAILLGSAIAWFLGHRITRRLYAIQETIAAVHSGNRLARSALAGTDEAAVMAREFNQMLDVIVERDTELREKTEELDHYFTDALDLLCIADTDGYFRRLNPAWEATLGLSVSELEGRRFLDFVHPDDMEATLQAVSRLTDQQEVLNFTNRYRNNTG